MINAYALSKARYLVDKCGTKEILINNELFAKYCSDVEIFKLHPSLSEILGALHDANSVPIAPFVCILWALYEKDIVDEQTKKTPEEYFRLIFAHEDAAKRIEFFYYNLNENKYDDALKEQDKKIILENSITFFEKKFSPLRTDKHYKKYQELLKAEEEKEEKRKNSIVDWITYDSIIGGLKSNINYNNQSLGNPDEMTAKTILDSLKKINMNFYIEYEPGFKIYPLIVDILSDLLLIEYYFFIEKEQTAALTSAKLWPSTKQAYEEGPVKSYTYLAFAKLVRVQEIGYRKLRKYFLAEYARTLNVDREELRILMQNIFFPIPENHTSSFGSGFNIAPIKPVPFFLENTKMVIGKL